MDKGKRKLSPEEEEEEEERRTLKKRPPPTPDGLRLQRQNFEHPSYDPPYVGPAPTLQYGDQSELSQILTSPDTEEITETFHQLFDFMGNVRVVKLCELRRSLANLHNATFICQAMIGHYVDFCLYEICGICKFDVKDVMGNSHAENVVPLKIQTKSTGSFFSPTSAHKPKSGYTHSRGAASGSSGEQSDYDD